MAILRDKSIKEAKMYLKILDFEFFIDKEVLLTALEIIDKLLS